MGRGECWDREGWTSNYDRKYAVKCLPKIQISEAVEIENKYKMTLRKWGYKLLFYWLGLIINSASNKSSGVGTLGIV